MRQQARYSLFGIGIVSDAPVRMINRLLQVDQQKDGAVRRCARDAYVANGLSGANSPTALADVCDS